jgi:hypothetical protein
MAPKPLLQMVCWRYPHIVAAKLFMMVASKKAGISQ